MFYSKKVFCNYYHFFAFGTALCVVFYVYTGLGIAGRLSNTQAFNEQGASTAVLYPAVCGTIIDTGVCGTSMRLNAAPNQTNYLWSTGETSSAITVTSTGTYWWETIDMDNNKVVNGNFSNGRTGFTSSYTYAAPTNNRVLYPEGTYSITTNPRNVHSNFDPSTDHSGNGNMMVVNGASQANVTVWTETINVGKNTDYIFSVWFTSVNAENPGRLNFSINNVPLGNPIVLSNQTSTWQNFTVRWNSKDAMSAVISIVNQNTIASGNDFALDDLVFAPVCRNTYNVKFYSNPLKPSIITQ
ncbi:hypothetical protein KHS38_00090 [Mucilaginibacter sp. Bleaf8]|uniref:hypothetical protein n=1 Tax=Mucilaginibacter sp. Bleaf8 TaxID=2834430 RepID=UPI001BCD2BD6|nr:hypothetical protein [Mucilaginibacter sp. Bleaf8]MBS7562788.1 hypothetical protein [Mucilaginibacter sp. Bleaf8]